ncbi:hypothetical protein BDL97_02G140500 [Sphagnum fallax]|nr:hypothetical protein BDL97_02G140500 [Sphagnum fallax]
MPFYALNIQTQSFFIFNKFGRLFSHKKIQNLYSHAF